MADSDNLGQDEIDRLLGQANAQAGPPAGDPPAAEDPESTRSAPEPSAADAPPPAQDGPQDTDVQALLQQAEEAIASVDQPVENSVPGLGPFQFQELGDSAASGEKASLDLLSDVDLDLRIELGRTQMYLEDILQLRKGSVVSLDKLAGDPVDIYVNGKLIARGEVLVLSETFCVRVGELISSEEEQGGAGGGTGE